MEQWTQRYLDFLGVGPLPRADVATLRRIARRHLERVPFESVTSVLRRRLAHGEQVPPLDVESMLDSWIARRSGALCFEASEMVSHLLGTLGYDAHPVLGQISFPGSHQAVLVHVDGARYLVDVGNGAPFFDPIPMDDTFEIRQAGLSYRFHPDGPGVSVQDRWIEGAWKPFCRYVLTPPESAEREAAYQQHHVIGCSWVVDTITVVSCTAHEVWSLRDLQLTHLTLDGLPILDAYHALQRFQTAT
jgi:arylamine N-acetyltransferase